MKHAVPPVRAMNQGSSKERREDELVDGAVGGGNAGTNHQGGGEGCGGGDGGLGS